jgi:short subunit dehydrogenase-like uncharacterized protein
MVASARRREFDVVLYGASGFVGRQTVAYFAQHAPPRLRWALAGRNEYKLRAARDAAGARAANAGLIVADAGDEAALGALAARARVVLSTAGPFALHGSALVAACVEHGTHYCDITGETTWVKQIIDAHHARAASDGTRIVPCCGFDSVPSDIGALLVADAVQRETGAPCVRVKACHTIRGGVNGGTLASILNIADSGALADFQDTFLLNPEGTAPDDRAPHADVLSLRKDADFDGAWLAPFVMAMINTRVVRRSAALLGAAAGYGDGFVYQEFLRTGRGMQGAALAAGMTLGLGLSAAALQLAPVRAAARKLLPAPGQGPSRQAMDRGFTRCELIGENARGERVAGRVETKGDPGNRATTVFVCEAALALASAPSRDTRQPQGGVLTPASALGPAYAQRLAAAGVSVSPLPTTRPRAVV